LESPQGRRTEGRVVSECRSATGPAMGLGGGSDGANQCGNCPDGIAGERRPRVYGILGRVFGRPSSALSPPSSDHPQRGHGAILGPLRLTISRGSRDDIVEAEAVGQAVGRFALSHPCPRVLWTAFGPCGALPHRVSWQARWNRGLRPEPGREFSSQHTSGSFVNRGAGKTLHAVGMMFSIWSRASDGAGLSAPGARQ
jgi:hypothetical protein